MARSARYVQRIRYWFDNTMSGGTPALIGWLALVSTTLVVLTSVAIRYLQPPDPAVRPRGPLGFAWDNFVRVFRLGVPDKGRLPVLALWLLLGLTGLFIASALVGVLNTALDRKLTQLHKGRSVVAERGHTVVLGWSDQIFTVVAELVEANASRRGAAVVILADRDKGTMDDAIRERVPATRGTRVVCRTGQPIDPGDLELVAPNDARAIIVLAPPEDTDADALVMKTLLAITNSPAFREVRHHVVASVRDGRNLTVAQLAGGGQATVVDADDITARLLVQTARQAGLSAVYLEILDYGGNEFYLVPEPGLAGWTFGDALLAYPASCLVGIVGPDGRSRLNPPAETVLSARDRLILLAADDDAVTLGAPAPVPGAAEIVAAGPRPGTAQRSLILGWNRRGRGVIRHLENYAAPHSTVDIVTSRPDAVVGVIALNGELRNLTVSLKEADSCSGTVLAGLFLRDYDHIMVLSDDELGPLHADARVLATLLHLRDIMTRTGHRVSVVSEIRDDRDRELAQLTEADDFVVSEKLISLLMTQISESRELAGVFAELFDPAGAEIYLKPAADYVRPGAEITFATLVVAARARGEVAIGYRSTAPGGSGVVLNPAKTAPLRLAPTDHVIVLAEG